MDNSGIGQAFIFGLLLVAFAYLGFAYRTKDSFEYHSLGRATGLTRTIATMFSVVGASEFVVFATLAYVFGWKAIWFFVGTMIGFFCLAFFVKVIRKDAVEMDIHSIPDFAFVRGYRLAGYLLATASFMFTLALVLLQVIIGGSIIASITGIPMEVSAAGVSAAICFYLLFGGYKALVNTDTVQALLLFLLTLVLAVYFTSQSDLPSNLVVASMPGVNIDVFVFAIGGFFAIFGGPEIWQRILNAQSNAKARTSSVISGIAMIIWGIALVGFALAVRTIIPDVDPDNAFVEFVSAHTSSVMLGFVVLLLLAALLSTADTELFAATVIFHKAVIGPSSSLKIGPSQFIIVVLTIATYIAAIQTQDLVNVYFAIVYLAFITGPIGICMVLGRGTGATLSLALAGSILVLIILYATQNLVGWYPLMIIAPAALPFFFRAKPTSS